MNYDKYFRCHAKNHTDTSIWFKENDEACLECLECLNFTTTASTIVYRNELKKFNRIVCFGYGLRGHCQTNCPSRSNQTQSFVANEPYFLSSPEGSGRQKIWTICAVDGFMGPVYREQCENLAYNIAVIFPGAGNLTLPSAAPTKNGLINATSL